MSIFGRTPPFRHQTITGHAENFFIHDGYEIRKPEHLVPYNDTGLRDEFQLPVYLYAREVLDHFGLSRVFDVGCGSGYKLITNFYPFETIGIDLADTIHHVRTQYPDRKWFTPDDDLSRFVEFGANLTICSDVIEHVWDPNELLNYLKVLTPRALVLSTPDRNQMTNGTFDGPPHNLAHIREWSMIEFHDLVETHFVIDEHFSAGGTQIALCH